MKLDNAIVIYGTPPSKSNCYYVITMTSKKTGKTHGSLGKANPLRSYEKDFAFQFPVTMRDKYHDSDFEFRINVYYPNNRSDLDNSLKVVLDCIQSAGYIKNDNKCKRIEAEKFIDKKSPRIEFEIIHYENELFI